MPTNHPQSSCDWTCAEGTSLIVPSIHFIYWYLQLASHSHSRIFIHLRLFHLPDNFRACGGQLGRYF